MLHVPLSEVRVYLGVHGNLIPLASLLDLLGSSLLEEALICEGPMT